jgi:hypothetical protein
VRGGRLQVDAPLDLPDDSEVELAVIFDEGDGLDAEDRARLDEALRVSKAELARGEAAPSTRSSRSSKRCRQAGEVNLNASVPAPTAGLS